MAKARMLHKAISLSEQVNNLSLPAQLLFTWLIPHADDEGRLKGNPKYIKALVVPYHHEWTSEEIESFLQEIEQQGLIYSWEADGKQYIEFPTWKRYQYIAKDRFHESELPFYKEGVDNPSTPRTQSVAKMTSQANVVESNIEEINKSEIKNNSKRDIKSLKEILEVKHIPDTNKSSINSREEAAAYYAWKALEPYNKPALQSTYLNAIRQGITADKIYQFVSEIKQDRTIKNPGKVFNSKVKNCRIKEDDKS